jgi:mono/diheme cytochrome c family protein
MMKSNGIALRVGWWLLLVALMLAAGAGYDVLAADDSGTMGRRFFERYCSACHGIDGRGQGPVAPALRTPPADLTQIAKRRGGQFPVAEIAAHIDGRADVRAHGSRDMPVWGERFSEQVGGGSLGEEVVRGNLLILVQYLQSLQQ